MAGNLRSDAQSFISAGDIIWSPYGKVLGVNILGGLTQNIFAYDAMQNRIKKRKVSSLGDISTVSLWASTPPNRFSIDGAITPQYD